MQSSKTVGAVINKSNIHLLQISRNLPKISNNCAENLTTRNQPDHLDTLVYRRLTRCIRNYICAECRPKSKDIYPKQPKSYTINKPTFLVSSSITRNAKLFKKFPAFCPIRQNRAATNFPTPFPSSSQRPQRLQTHVTKIN